MVRMGTLAVDGLNIFSREAGRPGNPTLVLLHGFPASSHQYGNPIPALADGEAVRSDGTDRGARPDY